MMAAASVYAAINAVTADLSELGISKAHINLVDDYRYRSIDDLLGALSPLLAKHRLCVLPMVLSRTVTERGGVEGSLLINVAVHVAFDLVSSEDGTSHRIEAYGEALDPSDKATAKAMSAAYKSAMLQVFCVPVGPNDDTEAASHKLKARTHVPEPVQGWEQWVFDIGDIVGVCESYQAIDLVQDRKRDLLTALSRERPDLYEDLGRTFEARRESLRSRERDAASPPSLKRLRKSAAKSRRELEVEGG